MERRTRVINQALTRPETVAGAEKMPIGLVVTAAVLFGMLGWFFLSAPAAVVALLLLFVGVPVVRSMGKADPQMVRVYRANLWIRPFYPARTSAHVREAAPKSSAGTIVTVGLSLAGAGWIFGSTLVLIGGLACALALGPIVHLAAKRRAPALAGE